MAHYPQYHQIEINSKCKVVRRTHPTLALGVFLESKALALGVFLESKALALGVFLESRNNWGQSKINNL